MKLTLPKALILVEHYGGGPLYVPKTIGPNHKLSKLIGHKYAQILAANYPAQTITIALHATGDHARHGAIRRHRIKELKKQGRSHTQIARELRTTDRTVRKVLGAEANDKQKKLF